MPLAFRKAPPLPLPVHDPRRGRLAGEADEGRPLQGAHAGDSFIRRRALPRGSRGSGGERGLGGGRRKERGTADWKKNRGVILRRRGVKKIYNCGTYVDRHFCVKIRRPLLLVKFLLLPHRILIKVPVVCPHAP